MIVLPTEAFQGYVNHPQIKRLYLTDVGYFPYAKNHYRERREGIEEYIYFFCMEGSGIIEVQDQRYMLHENEAFCIPRFCRHKYYACKDDPWSILWVHFTGEDTDFFPLNECKIVKFISKSSRNRMQFLFELLFRVLEGNYTLGNFIYISQVLALILAETYNREKLGDISDHNKHVTAIVRYMYKQLHRLLTLDELSREFELSKSYINEIFQKNTGYAPMEFFTNLKMKEACRLLRSSELFVYEIADELGYSDQYYFSRIFKKTVGISPKEYRTGDYFHYKD